MVLFLWAIAGALVIQLAFVLWNLAQLPRLGAGGNGAGRRWLEGLGMEDCSEDSRSGALKLHGVQDCPLKSIFAEADGSPSTLASGEAVPRLAAPLGSGLVPHTPRLSILIPARDEASNISACLQSVLAEPSTYLEVLVLDDRSTDGTTGIALAAAAGDPRLRVLAGEPLPEGWMGKSYACHQLVREARGQWWLFLDADARLSPGALTAAMDTALNQEHGLVTGFPRQETGTWLERLVVPLMTFTIACHLPIGLVRRSQNPLFVAAHGAFMLIHADSYQASGGHAAFKSHLVDDMQLARAVKQAGLPVTLANIHQQVSMRMYRDAIGVWNGYKKNIFTGMGRNSLLLVSILLLYSLMYIVPPLVVLTGLFSMLLPAGSGLPELWTALMSEPVAWGGLAAPSLLSSQQSAPLFMLGLRLMLPALLGCLLGAAIKLAVDRSGGQPLRFAWLLPAGILALIAIATASWHAAFSGKGYWWKGRKYT